MPILYCSPGDNSNKIKGIKIYPVLREGFNISDIRHIISETGLNAIFYPPYEGKKCYYPGSKFLVYDSANSILSLQQKIKTAGIQSGMICQVFYDKDTFDEKEYLRAVDDKGSTLPQGWQKMICPSDSNYKEYKLDIIEEVAGLFKPDYILLDFVRYPVFWEEIKIQDREKDIREYCFCERCREKFSGKMNLTEILSCETILKSKKSLWVNYKAGIISSFLSDCNKRIKKASPNTEIIVNVIPWKDNFGDNALMNIAGQNLEMMNKFVDYFSPMIYSEMIGADESYAGELISELSEKDYSIVPAIKLPEKMGDIHRFKAEFNDVFSEKTDGAIFFHYDILKKCFDKKPELFSLIKGYP